MDERQTTILTFDRRQKQLIGSDIVKALNYYLHRQGTGFFVGLVGNGSTFCWLNSTELKDDKSLFRIKVASEFIEDLVDLIEAHFEIELTHESLDDDSVVTAGCDYDEELDQSIYTLFQDELLKHMPQEHGYYPYYGIVVGSFAEFSVHCGDLKGFIEYKVGDLHVRVSRLSFLLRHLHYDHFDDYLMTIDSAETIKISGTSPETVQQDLATCLYYLRKIAPVDYDSSGWPEITMFVSEGKDLPSYEHELTQSREYMAPLRPKAVQFFYAAEKASPMGQNDVAVLNYYRVMEHFFDEAWHRKISQILVTAGGNVPLIASNLRDSTPRKDLEYLNLVINQVVDDDVWEVVSTTQFCDHTENALANKIYKTRNQVAHGLDEESRGNVPHPPSVIPAEDLHKQRKVMGVIAKKCLLFYNKMT